MDLGAARPKSYNWLILWADASSDISDVVFGAKDANKLVLIVINVALH